jgi:hypothetical protein
MPTSRFSCSSEDTAKTLFVGTGNVLNVFVMFSKFKEKICFSSNNDSTIDSWNVYSWYKNGRILFAALFGMGNFANILKNCSKVLIFVLKF